MPRSDDEKTFVLDHVIPQRLHALYALTISIDIRGAKDPADDGRFSLAINGKTRAEGNAAGVIDPWLEIGIVHGRALLEFLGLWESNGRLTERQRGRPNDWRLTDFDLPSVTPAQAIASYAGGADEAEQSLVSIMVFANRAIAHITEPVDPERFGSHHLQIACRGIYALIARYLYTPLEREAPDFYFRRNA